mgnify:FL=1
MSQTQKGQDPSGSMKNENYVNVLKNENIELDNKLKKMNQLVSKLKLQISENEKEKKLILSTSNQKEQDLQNIKKQLEQAKSKVDELKNMNNEKIISLSNQNNILKNKSELDVNTIAELQEKITDLEFKLKSSNLNANTKNNKFSVLYNTHNYSLVFEGSPQKNQVTTLPDILGIKFENQIDNQNDNLFLTGRNELIEMKDNNQKLLEQLNMLQNELTKHQNERKNMNDEIEKYYKEKKELMDNLNKKNEILNNKKNEENELNNNLMKQLMENKKIKNNLDNITIKCKNLEKDKKELEDVILEQENKVNELSSSVNKIIEMMNQKNTEIINNKLYIKNLEETIKDLNREFYNMRMKKKKENSKEIVKLRTQLANLKKENQKLLEQNIQNNEKNNESIRNYEFIPIKNKRHSMSRNHQIINEMNNRQGLKKVRIKSNIHLNNTTNRQISNVMDSSTFLNRQIRKNKDDIIRLQINRKKHNQKLYNYNYNLTPLKKRGIQDFNGNKNLNIINLNNIKIKNLGNLKYNKSVLNLQKLNQHMENTPNINDINKYNNDNKLDSPETSVRKTKLKKINSIIYPLTASDDRTSNTENTNKNNIFQTKSTVSNLNKIKDNNEIINNEKVEKEKIQEFKNLLQQIVSDIES